MCNFLEGEPISVITLSYLKENFLSINGRKNHDSKWEFIRKYQRF